MQLDLTKPIEVQNRVALGLGYSIKQLHEITPIDNMLDADARLELTEAYRRLFEAAPEMLKALQTVKENLDDGFDTAEHTVLPDNTHLHTFLKQLFSKIEGREQQ